MEKQNYRNHPRYVPLFHFVTFALVALTLIGAVVTLIMALTAGGGIIGAAQFLAVSVILVSYFFFQRRFALRAQDRAIRAEENLRHFVLTGKLLDGKISMTQVIALRFAVDDEFVGLAQRTAAENLSNDDIKRTVRNWRGDHYRA